MCLPDHRRHSSCPGWSQLSTHPPLQARFVSTGVSWLHHGEPWCELMPRVMLGTPAGLARGGPMALRWPGAGGHSRPREDLND